MAPMSLSKEQGATYAVATMIRKFFLELSSDGGERTVSFFWGPSFSEIFAIALVSPFPF